MGQPGYRGRARTGARKQRRDDGVLVDGGAETHFAKLPGQQFGEVALALAAGVKGRGLVGRGLDLDVAAESF